MNCYYSTPIDISKYEEEYGVFPKQISQITVKSDNNRLIEVCIEEETGKVIIDDGDLWFYFSSPNIPKMRMIDVIYGLGFRNEIIVVDWCEIKLSPKDILVSLVEDAPLNQITLYTRDKYESMFALEVSMIVILIIFILVWYYLISMIVQSKQ